MADAVGRRAELLHYRDLFQRPFPYAPAALAIHRALAAELASLTQAAAFPVFRHEALMLEPRADYGPGMQETGKNLGIGASFTNPAEALIKSVFEAWERKASKTYDPGELVRGSWKELAGRAIPPEEFALITDWEYQQSPLSYVRYHADLPLSWKRGYRIQPGRLEPVLLPATLVYSRFGWKNPAERFAPNLSPGLAAHTRMSEAVLAGLCELIERDAFMLTWLHRRRPPRIPVDDGSLGEARPAWDSLRRLGFEVHFLDLTTDFGVPVILAVIEHRQLPWHGTLVLGLGCHLDPRQALRKAFLEAIVMLGNHVTIDQERSELILHKRPLAFGLRREDYYPKAHFLIEGNRETTAAETPNQDRRDPGRNLEWLIGHLERKGRAVYFIDMTPARYKSSRLCLTRAFIAGLQPMLYEPDCWRLNPQRLFGQAPPAFERLNLLPHPFMLFE